MKKSFLKMQGLGNDFAVFDGREDGFHLLPEQIRLFADRRRGIGFDQAIVISPAKSVETEAFLHIYNADGGGVGACGNATRCVAAFLMQEMGKSQLTLETIAGKLPAWRDGAEIAVDMGPARLDWKDIPLAVEQDTLCLPLVEGPLEDPVAVGMGNPHAVFFVDDAEAVPLDILGPRIETHPLFPRKTNVEVVQVLSPTRLRMRVWERGTGITPACGTGACAAAVAAVRRGLAGREVTVALDGGDLRIAWRESDGHVIMTGEAATVYAGEVFLENSHIIK